VNKSATVQDILDEAKKDFKFSEDGTGILRFFHPFFLTMFSI